MNQCGDLDCRQRNTRKIEGKNAGKHERIDFDYRSIGSQFAIFYICDKRAYYHIYTREKLRETAARIQKDCIYLQIEHEAS